MTLKIVETTVTEAAVRVRFADDADPAKAIEWLDLRFPVSKLESSKGNSLGDPRKRTLAAIHQAALLFAQDVIDAETEKIAALADRNSR